MRICPFTSVCRELEALKNCECCSVTGATPGTRFSRLWKLRFELTSGTFASTFRSIFWAVDALSVCSGRGRCRHFHRFGDAARLQLHVDTRVGVHQQGDLSPDSFLNPVASTPTEYTPGGRLGTIQFPLSFVSAV